MPQAEWGGFKQSGIGRELGPTGLAEYRETKHIWQNIRPDAATLVRRLSTAVERPREQRMTGADATRDQGPGSERPASRPAPRPSR